MSRSRADLRFKALSIIVGGDVGQAPSNEDATALDAYIDDEVAELQAKSIVYISDLDAIENEIFGTLAQLVANAAADEFGGRSDPQKKLYYENQMRNITRQTPGYGPQETSYF
jgi:hypothetical protein